MANEGRADDAELAWWRHFAAKQTSDSQLPRVGTPLLGHHYTVVKGRAGLFELEDAFVITGRGTCVTGYVTGLVNPGDTMQCGEHATVIRGVERHPVIGADTRIDRRTAGLLVEGATTDYQRGTRWVIRNDESGAPTSTPSDRVGPEMSA